MLSAPDLDDVKRVMDTNCWSPAELARLFIPQIVRNGGGAVVNILSVGAYFCLPEFSSYSISKAAAAIMTAGLRAETDRQPVLVSQVVTGSVLTRASPVGTKFGFTPVQHAEEVFDALAQGETEILAAGSKGFFERLRADPKAFERGVIDRLLRAIDPQPGERFVEIGPGEGALTIPLLARVGRLTAIELDRDLPARLRAAAAGVGELEIVEADALTVDIAALSHGAPIRLVGNLPYNISTPILFHLLGAAAQVVDQHFMLQKEVALRMSAAPGGMNIRWWRPLTSSSA